MSTGRSDASPYKGLRPYTEADREYFFGRETDLEVIASNLSFAPLTILYGASGVGKSSVLQAGVIPQLKKRQHTAIVFFNSWQSDSFGRALNAEVLRALCESTGMDAPDVLRGLSTTLGKSITDVEGISLDELLVGCARAFRLSVLVIFDQFEEYFLYHTPSSGSEGFDAEMARAVNGRESGVNFLLAMREEELGKLDRFRARIPNLLSNLLRLEHLSPEAAVRAIRGPLEIYNGKYPAQAVEIERELVDAIIKPERLEPTPDGDIVHAQPAPAAKREPKIETPFLQLVLTRLWEAERAEGSRLMRLSTLERLGGARKIARAYLDDVMEKLSEPERAAAAAVLRFLVTPTGSKIALQPSALAAFAERDEAEVLHILTRLSSGQDVHVLRKVSVPGQAERYELFHDVLGPAIVEWRARYVQAQKLDAQREEAEKQLAVEAEERAKAESQLARERSLGRRLRFLLAVMALLLLAFIVAAAASWQQMVQRKVAESQTEEEKRLRAESEENLKTVKRLLDDKVVLNTMLRGAVEDTKEQQRIAEEQQKIAEASRNQAIAASKEAIKQRDIARAKSLELENQIKETEKQRKKAATNEAYYENLSRDTVAALGQLNADQNSNDQARVAAATQQLQQIVADLEKDADTAAILKAANVSSNDTDGAKLIRGLVSLKRSIGTSNSALTYRVDQAIVANVQKLNTVAYGSFDSIRALEISLEADEARLMAEIVGLQLAKRDGQDITVATYREGRGAANAGNLIIEESTNSPQQIANHLAKGDRVLFEGEAYIRGRGAVKVLVFRGR